MVFPGSLMLRRMAFHLHFGLGVHAIPPPLMAGFRAAEAASTAIRKNQIRSIGYNIAAVTLAALGLVNPLIAAVLMPLSSGMVIWGASRVEKDVGRGENRAGGPGWRTATD